MDFSSSPFQTLNDTELFRTPNGRVVMMRRNIYRKKFYSLYDVTEGFCLLGTLFVGKTNPKNDRIQSLLTQAFDTKRQKLAHEIEKAVMALMYTLDPSENVYSHFRFYRGHVFIVMKIDDSTNNVFALQKEEGNKIRETLKNLAYLVEDDTIFNTHWIERFYPKKKLSAHTQIENQRALETILAQSLRDANNTWASTVSGSFWRLKEKNH